MSDMPGRRQLQGLFGWLMVTFVAATLGSIASMNAPAFYEKLVRPEWTPPAGAFGPVWTFLYASKAVAPWLVWRKGGFRASCAALTLFLVQLVVNAVWSWLFFVWRLGALAFFDTLLLVALILATLIAFWRTSRLAGLLLIPYLAWVVFASILSYRLWQLNPEILG